MLFQRHILDGIADGTVTLAFRRWERARVRPGGTLRTAVGVIGIDAVEVVREADVTDTQARAAGYDSAAGLLAWVAANGRGDLHRIRLHLAGPDPRVALREHADLDPAELGDVRARLARADRAADRPWTAGTLRLIAAHPGTRAADLAARQGVPTDVFKRRVRRLKDLGLTESLGTGYRISPRGAAVLAAVPE
ncbi:ASCH domain-containing protein [Marinitenerispora sediminis]|uniref:ASCH domain-containing protein n=1 Tax=Marinitenerispora sediminis TaxID=1931232 RepID=A0A368T8T3_9ACTN|nr:ASCH domain-containing protein [Marinitenerispora sediminis]RCV52078.1 hypothetical protein DEF28_14000 [Marinitenerispora sediminis]RCV58097.1 hypothetical protein DEF23_09645 [Marinitenerispora sediminis]RCV60841.1 hypothetical protein DEF24_05885 [Marinitenerispora sediminis]